MPVVPFIPLIAAGVGAAASKHAGDKAQDSAEGIAANSDALEREKLEEAKRQADILRQRGDESAAVALEEAAKLDAAAAQTDADARTIYTRIQEAAQAKQAAGQDAKSAINAAKQEVMSAAGMNESQMNAALSKATAGVDAATAAGQAGMKTAFDNSSTRLSPFINSETSAIGQLGAEMGLTSGTQYKGYQDSPAYKAAQDASRVAEQEGIKTIDQAAGNSGTLYSGTRGAALADRSKRGSYERAGIEQSYYQNYMNMLQGMANPTSTTNLSGMEQTTALNSGQMGVDSAKFNAGLTMGAAENIGGGYMNAAGTGLNATVTGEQMGLDTMRTGAEGSNLLGYENNGTAGSAMRQAAADYRLNTQATAGGMITGNMPNGSQGSDARLLGVEAQNAATADMVGGLSEGVSNYMKYGRNTSTASQPYNYNYMGN